MYAKPLIGTVAVPNPLKSAGKTAVCVEVSERFPLTQSRYDYPAGFYVKGKVNWCHVKMVKLIKLKDGSFLFPVPNDIRRKLKLKVGSPVSLDIQKDRLYYGMHDEFMMAYFQEPQEVSNFYYIGLSKMEQHRYNEWIWTAKDDAQRHHRIIRALPGMRNKLSFAEMRKETSSWPSSI